MKKFLILFIASISATLFADPKDPVFNGQQLQEIHSASPAKPAVSVEKPRKVLLFSKTLPLKMSLCCSIGMADMAWIFPFNTSTESDRREFTIRSAPSITLTLISIVESSIRL